MFIAIGDSFTAINQYDGSKTIVRAMQISERYGMLICDESGNRWTDRQYMISYDTGRPRLCIDDQILSAQDEEEIDFNHSKIFFRYVYSNKTPHTHAATFAIYIDYENFQIVYAYSICNGDRFNKAIGRQFATYKLNQNPNGFRFETLTDLRKFLNETAVLDMIQYHMNKTDSKNFKLIKSISYGEHK